MGNATPALTGIPDWSGARTAAGEIVLPVYGTGQSFVLVPDGAVLADNRSGRPDFRLEFYSNPSARDPTDILFAMIGMRLEFCADMAASQQALRATVPSATLQVSGFAPGGWWTLESPQADIQIGPVAWANGRDVQIYQRLPKEVGLILWSGLKAGTLAARALLQIELASILPRLQATVSFAPRVLLGALHALAQGDGVPVDPMIRAFEARDKALGLDVDGPVSDLDRPAFAKAMLGRVRLAYGQLVPASVIGGGAYLALTSADDAALPVVATWDLSRPQLAPWPIALNFDPFTAAQRIVAKEGVDAVMSFVSVPPTDGADTLQVVIVSGLPQRTQIAGALSIDVTLRVEGVDAPHGNAYSETVTLFPMPQSQTRTVALKFRDPQSRRYSYQVRVITEQKVLRGQPTPLTSEYIYIGLAELPVVPLSVVLQDTLLLLVASVGVRLLSDDDDVLLDTTLDNATPAVTWLATGTVVPARLQVVAHSADPAGGLRVLELPARSTTISAFSFPSYGEQVVRVTVRFAAATASARYEFEPETGGDVIMAETFSPQDPERDIRYFAADLFRNCYRYRAAAAEGTSEPGPWTGLLDPGLPLLLDA